MHFIRLFGFFCRLCFISAGVIPVLHAASHEHAPESASDACASLAALPSADCARSPTPAFGRDGRLWLAWYQRGHVYVQSSGDLGQTFSSPVVVNRVPERVDDQGEDRVQIRIGPADEIYLVWTQKLEKKYTGHIRFSRSLDGGQHFDDPVNVNDDLAEIGHRFPAMTVTPAGEVTVVWIDKRPLEASKQADQAYRGASLFYARSQDRGASFQFNRTLIDHACECCRLAMGWDGDTAPVVLYRHVFPGQIRDHALIYFDGQGRPGSPVRVSEDDWRIEGCPHHGPALASAGPVQHMVWFTQGTQRQGLQYARATQTHTGVEISAPVPFGAPASERPAVAVMGTVVALAWKRFTGELTVVEGVLSRDGGETWSDPQTLASTAGASDHPILIQNGKQVYLSWRSEPEGYRLIPLGTLGVDS